MRCETHLFAVSLRYCTIWGAIPALSWSNAYCNESEVNDTSRKEACHESIDEDRVLDRGLILVYRVRMQKRRLTWVSIVLYRTKCG